ncbi:MAG: hypothetical protein HY920_08980 [Elusimicrobia bacterium]|nr:hypothetical protein [Elusimicrobiota bacterium]
MNKTLDELHKIREEIYEEEKNLTIAERLKKIHKESEAILKKHNLKLRIIQKKAVGV